MQHIKVGLAGLGTVGQGLLEVLREQQDAIAKGLNIHFQIEHVVDRNYKKKKSILADIKASDNINDILHNPDIDLFIELIGGLQPSYEWIKTALRKGKSVVTANKLLLSERGSELFKIVRETKNRLYCEAAVAGAIPIVQNIQESLIANDVYSIYAILNSSSNFILSLMEEENLEYKEAIQVAQDKGYTEADPSLDVEGYDAAQKISLLANLAFGEQVKVESGWISGIQNIRQVHFDMARKLNMRIVPLAVAHNKTKQIYVSPTLIPRNHILSSVRKEMNAIMLDTNQSGLVVLIGQGAGKKPTAASVVGDMVHYAKKQDHYSTLFFQNDKVFQRRARELAKFYIHLKTKERVGILSQLTSILAKNNISLASLQQNESTEPIEIAMVTHLVEKKYLDEAMKEITKLKSVYEKVKIFRIEISL